MKTFTLSLLLSILYYAAGAQCAAPVVTASGPTSFCPGGSVTLSAPASTVWTQKAGFGGTARQSAVSFSIGSKGYIGTGSNSNDMSLKDFWEYNPATGVWTQKANLGGAARGGAVGFSIGSKGYIGTGYGIGIGNYYSDFWEYDPANNSWMQKADFGGTARGAATGFSIGSKGYIGTGISSGGEIKDFWEYNPSVDKWTQKADFGGTARGAATGFSIGSKGYIGTGSSSSGDTNDFWEYNPATDKWTRKADFGGAARYFATGFSIGSKGYIGTGYNGSFLKDFWEYNPATDAWTQKADFGGTAREGATGFSIGSKGYIGTGISNFTSVRDFWEYDPGYTYSWSPGGQTTPSITAGASGNYTITTTNALGCSATSAATLVTVNTPATPVITASGSTVICPDGGNVTLSASVGDTWAQKTDFGGTERQKATGFSIGSKGYIGAGFDGNSVTKDFWEYDPATSVWSQKVDFGGTAVSGAVGFSIGSKGYIGMGSYTKEFWEYDQAANKWTRKADFGGDARQDAIGFSIGSKGYFGTGFNNSNSSLFYKDFWEYDPASDKWTQKTDFGGTATLQAVGFSIGNKGYIGTGYSSSGNTKDFWEYDPATDKWAKKTDFGGGSRRSAVGFSIGSKGYIGTGVGNAYLAKDFWEYDPATDKWTQKADFGNDARYNATGLSIGSKGYIGLGISIDNFLKDFWEYDPGYTYLWSPGGQTTSAITVSSPGNYTVTTTDALGCSATSIVTKVTALPSTLYVDSSKATSGDGSSWANAFKEVREALYAASQCSSITTINIAKGTYKPTNDTNRDSAFTILRGGLKIYGGYPGGGGTRNPAVNPTVLSGDIGTAGNASDNSYHVFVIAGLTGSADSLVLDGFTVTGGNANGSNGKIYNGAIVSGNEGAGIYLHSNNGAGGKIAVRNCTVTGNTSATYGGGFYNQLSSPAISNCRFTNNTAADGSGMFNYNASSPSVSNCSFTANTASNLGAGMHNFNGSSPSVINCSFIANMGNGVYNSSSSPSFTNCIFVSNNAVGNGSAMYNANSSSVVTNCTFTLNTSGGNSTVFNENPSSPQFTNCIIWGNAAIVNGGIVNTISTPTVTYSDVQGGYSGTGNISSDPLFVNSNDADGADNIYGTADDGIALQYGSPVINIGNNAGIPPGITKDITGAARIQNTTVDMGAYEAPDCSSYTILYVDSSRSAPGNGLSWATAFKTVQPALDVSNSCNGVRQIWIKKGTYYPTTYPFNCTDCAASGTARDYTFALRDGLEIYGGFAGTETDTAQRVAGNTTVLSGDIGTPNNNSDNCYHVLFAINGSNKLSGLTVTGGNANDNGTITVAGQTIYRSNGGGMYQYTSSANLYNCTFSSNTAKSEGGGVYNVYGSALRINKSRFLNNHSGSGGAIRLLYGNAGFISLSSVYSGNTASSNDGGALSLVMGNGKDTLINNVFTQNKAFGSTADNGGGALVQESGTSSYLVNNTFYADSAASNGGAIRFKSGGSNRYVYNNIFYKSYNGTANTDVSLESGTTITAQSNNLYSTTNPLFINEADADGADNLFGTSDDGLKLQTGSPAQNTGSNAAIPTGITTDIKGDGRIANCTVDMGAYEVSDNVNTYWTGLVSNDWNNGGNWCGGVPGSGASVVVPVSAPYPPRLSSPVALNNLMIATGTSVSLNGNVLTLTGTINGTGVMTGSPLSSLVINGSGDAGTLYFDPSTDGTTNVLRDMTVNRASGIVTLGNKLNLTGTYTPSAGVLNSNGYLTLKSSVGGTAGVAQGSSSGGYITGNVTVERYTDGGTPASQNNLGGRRAWRLLSAPVTGTTIYDGWQESGVTTNSYGTLITGEGLTSAQATGLGFDYIGGGNHTSIKQYDSANNAWVQLTTNSTLGTRIPLRSHPAYMVFVRGDRTVRSTTGKSVATLRTSGTLLQGEQTLALSPGSLTLAGNPYASAIDFGSLYSHNRTLIQNQFYEWNSGLGDYGAYVLVRRNAGNTGYEATPAPFTATIPDDRYRLIPGGAGFFLSPVRTGTAGTITFEEGDKASGVPAANPFFELPSAVKELKVNLNLKNSDTSLTLADGFLVQFDDYFRDSLAQAGATSSKVANFNENVAVVRNGTSLIADARPDVQGTDTVFMKLWYVTKRNYRLQIKADNFATTSAQAWLEDSYLGTKQPIDLTGAVTNADFSVTGDSASYRSDRFRIVFRNTVSNALPVTLTSLKAAPVNESVSVNWTVRSEVNMKGYTVQRSTDGGRTYTDIAAQLAKNGTGAAVTSYSSYDVQPNKGSNLYRIRMEAKDAAVSYSQSVKVNIGESSGVEVSVYPNPATIRATVHIDKVRDGMSIVLTDSKGGIVWKKENITDTDTSIPIAHFSNGTYLVTIQDKEKTVQTLKLVKAD